MSIFSNVDLSTSDVDESSEFIAVRFEATFEGVGLDELFENLTLLEPFSDAYRNVIATSAGKSSGRQAVVSVLLRDDCLHFLQF